MSRSRRVLVIALTAALGALAIAGATLGYVLGGDDAQPSTAAPASSPAGKNPACAEVSRQYSWWNQETRAVVGLPNLKQADAKSTAKKLIAAGDALDAVLQRYRDGSVQALARAVSDHDAAIRDLAADIDDGEKLTTLSIGEALFAHEAADVAYTEFLRSSC